jgi:RNA polymerase sigma factor (sigma-70 family)
MSPSTVLPTAERQSDESLIQECIDGNEEAWSALVERYRKLIFSIPIRSGLSREDASEIFQEVCLTLVSELPRLRHRSTLPAWLIQVTVNRCLRWRKTHSRLLETSLDPRRDDPAIDSAPDSELYNAVMREQALRDAIAELNPRCSELMQMLFFTHPPIPYEDVAKRLGIAKGSIGFIRMRCLKRLRRALEERGF